VIYSAVSGQYSYTILYQYPKVYPKQASRCSSSKGHYVVS